MLQRDWLRRLLGQGPVWCAQALPGHRAARKQWRDWIRPGRKPSVTVSTRLRSAPPDTAFDSQPASVEPARLTGFPEERSFQGWRSQHQVDAPRLLGESGPTQRGNFASRGGDQFVEPRGFWLDVGHNPIGAARCALSQVRALGIAGRSSLASATPVELRNTLYAPRELSPWR